MAKKQLAKSFWNEIAAAVVYIKNGYFSMESKTFFKKYNNLLLDVSNLRLLGCRVWVYIPDIISKLIIDLHSWQKIMVKYKAHN